MEAAPRSISSRTKPKIADLVNLVVPQAADKWEKICVQLIGDEHRHIVSTIRRDGHGSEDCCQRMFDQWLDLSKKPTWKDVIDALESGSVRKIALAEELKEHLGVFVCVCACMCVSRRPWVMTITLITIMRLDYNEC